MSTDQGKTILVDGRIVWTSGDLFTGKLQTIFGTQTPALNAAGEQKKQYGFGLAVPKSVLNQLAEGQPGHIWTVIHEEAYKLYPSRQLPPSFAMKYKDGDGIDDQGQPFGNREGYAGHLVFACTTALPIKYYRWDAAMNQNVQVSEGIKCGDYVKVQLSIKAHAAHGQGKPGLYLNPLLVQLTQPGPAIVNAPSGNQVFGGTQPVAPPGALAMPAAPFPSQAPSAPVAPGFPAPVAQPAYAAPVAPQPHYGVLPPQHQPMTQQPPAYAQQAGQPFAPAASGFPAIPGIPNR